MLAITRTPANVAGGPWPMQKTCKLVYFQQLSINVASGVGQYIFTTNGLYDPNITGIGNQPLYFDQLMEIYNHYVVTSSAIEVTPLGSTASRDEWMTMYIDDDTTVSSSGTAPTRPGAKTKAFNSFVQTTTPMRHGWNAERNFGPGVLNNTLFRGNASSNPAEQMYYVVQINDTQLGDYALPILVKITYTATFTELKTVPGS